MQQKIWKLKIEVFGSNKTITGVADNGHKREESYYEPFQDENIVGKIILCTRFSILRVFKHVNFNKNIVPYLFIIL